MKGRLDSLEALFKHLRQATAPKAQKLFEKLRSNVAIQSLLQGLDGETGVDDEIDTGRESRSVDNQKQVLAQLADKSGKLPLDDSPEERQHLPPPIPLGDGGQVVEPTENFGPYIKIPSASVTQAAVENFFNCAGSLLHVFSRDEAKILHEEVFGGRSQEIKWRALYAASVRWRPSEKHMITAQVLVQARSSIIRHPRVCSKI
jgi:hypothetical protein